MKSTFLNFQKLSFWLILFFSSGLLFWLQSSYIKELSQEKTISKEQVEIEEEQEKSNLQVLKQTPSFGFDNLIANLSFLNFLQYFGDEKKRSLVGYSLSPEYFDIVIKHDPKFLGIHYFISTSVSLYAGMPERSIALMDEALKSNSPQITPKAYYVWRNKGIDELLFLGDSKAAQKSFMRASEWAAIHPDEESQRIASSSYQTAQFLLSNPSSKRAQIAAWSMVLSNAVDENTKNIAINTIEALGAKIVVNANGQFSIIPPPDD